jgi:Flp pilus assembly protein TadD
MGQTSQAEATYQRAIALRPGDWWSLKQIGLFYLNKGRYPEAEQYFRKVIQLTPESAKAYSNLGVVYVRMHRGSDAVAQFEKSISIEPNAGAYNNVGYIYYFDGRYPDAAAQFEKATLLAPTDYRIWGGLADAYRFSPALAGKAPETFRHAIELIEKEIAINPRDGRLHARLAAYCAAVGDREKAAAESHRAIELAPGDGAVQFRVAEVSEQARHRDEALRALQASLQAGYPLEEILKAPILAGVREDPRFAGMVNAAKRARSTSK